MLELLKAPCLLFKVQWLLGHFSLIIQCTSVRQFPPYRPRSRKHPGAKHSYARARLNVQPDTSVKDALTHLEERLLVDTVPVQVREQGAVEHSQPHAWRWLRPPARTECQTKVSIAGDLTQPVVKEQPVNSC